MLVAWNKWYLNHPLLNPSQSVSSNMEISVSNDESNTEKISQLAVNNLTLQYSVLPVWISPSWQPSTSSSFSSLSACSSLCAASPAASTFVWTGRGQGTPPPAATLSQAVYIHCSKHLNMPQSDSFYPLIILSRTFHIKMYDILFSIGKVTNSIFFLLFEDGY